MSWGFETDPEYQKVLDWAEEFVTDEVDCSFDWDYEDIFLEAGGKVFWSDPNAAFPTSAVCWTALILKYLRGSFSRCSDLAAVGRRPRCAWWQGSIDPRPEVSRSTAGRCSAYPPTNAT